MQIWPPLPRTSSPSRPSSRADLDSLEPIQSMSQPGDGPKIERMEHRDESAAAALSRKAKVVRVIQWSSECECRIPKIQWCLGWNGCPVRVVKVTRAPRTIQAIRQTRIEEGCLGVAEDGEGCPGVARAPSLGEDSGRRCYKIWCEFTIPYYTTRLHDALKPLA